MTTPQLTPTFVGLDAQIDASGNFCVRRIELDGRWLPVGQGRQWQDDAGHHIMIMTPDQDTRELILRVGSSRWELKPKRRFGRPIT